VLAGAAGRKLSASMARRSITRGRRLLPPGAAADHTHAHASSASRLIYIKSVSAPRHSQHHHHHRRRRRQKKCPIIQNRLVTIGAVTSLNATADSLMRRLMVRLPRWSVRWTLLLHPPPDLDHKNPPLFFWWLEGAAGVIAGQGKWRGVLTEAAAAAGERKRWCRRRWSAASKKKSGPCRVLAAKGGAQWHTCLFFISFDINAPLLMLALIHSVMCAPEAGRPPSHKHTAAFCYRAAAAVLLSSRDSLLAARHTPTDLPPDAATLLSRTPLLRLSGLIVSRKCDFQRVLKYILEVNKRK